ncbi:MAG: family 20 glycosylhydrolase, partial [Firmicutes bacterium]|nr:family 20 glycosylhydrolase [Bacillota bacterium]
RYHVEVIPSFDSPGHMEYIVKKYKNYIAKHPNYKFKYNGKTYSKKRSGFKNISNYFKYRGTRSSYNYIGIDLANPTARAFTNALIDEYAVFFKKQGCTKFNIGGDELLGWSNVTLKGRTFTFYDKWEALQHWDNYAKNVLHIKKGKAIDTFISYLNTTARRLEKKGYTCRVWNDEIERVGNQHVKLKKSIHIVYWSNKFEPIGQLKKKGYKFHNAVSLWTYYVTTDGGGYKRSNKEDIYRHWNPKSFADPFKKAKTVPSSQYAGAYFCIWCDYPNRKTQKEVWTLTKGRTWSNSTKMWNRQINTTASGSGKVLSYAVFQKYTTRLGTFPGYSGDPAKTSHLPKAAKIKKVTSPEKEVPLP